MLGDMEVVNRITEYRKAMHLSKADLAEILDISVSTYTKLEKNEDFSFVHLQTLADLFEIPVDKLLYGELGKQEKPPHKLSDVYNVYHRNFRPTPSNIREDMMIILSKISYPRQYELYEYALYLYYKDTKRRFGQQ